MSLVHRPLKIFIIYAHEDRAFKDELLKSLKLLRTIGYIEAWHDRDLMAGDDWDATIRKHLSAADLIIPIISKDFFVSDYIEQVEIEEAFQRYERKEVHILPVIARPCRWTDDPRISKLQVLPEEGHPISRHSDQDEAFNSVYDGIKAKIMEIRAAAEVAAEQERLKAQQEEKKILADIIRTAAKAVSQNPQRRNEAILRVAASIDPGQEADYQLDNYTIGADLEAGIWTLPSGDVIPGSKGTLLVVADGMDGLNAGEVASKIVVKSIQAYFYPTLLSSATANPGKWLVEGILYANGEILKHAKKNPDTEGLGTTVVLAWILDGALHVAWSGDSRCYLLRQGRSLHQVNHDHSYVQELVDMGEISQEDAFYHPDKDIITQSLGDVGRQPWPSYECTHLQPGDRILLCSAGLNRMLHDAEIEGLLASGSVINSTRNLVRAANEAGGHYNITAVVCEVVSLG